MVLWQTSRLFKSKETADLKISSWLPAFLVSFQLALGILSVLASTEIIPNQWGLFEWMAQFHQLVAMALLLSQVWLLYLVRRQPAL